MERKLRTKRPELCEKSQSGGCMWGLIGILDFCQGNSKRKLLSDGRHLNRHVVGTGNSRSRLKLLPNFDEKCQEIDDGANKKSLTVDVGERSVKKFIEEEMSTEQHISKQATSTELKHIESDSGLFGHLAKNHKKSSKTCQRAYQLPAQDRKDVVSVGHQEPSFPSSMETSSDKLNLAAMLEAFCNETHHENGRQYGNEQRSISCARYDELNEINLQLDGANHQSKHFLDAFEILNANKEVFLELLQDPNSLLSKHIQHLLNSPTEKEKTESVSEAKFLECGINNPRNCEEAVCNVKFRKQNMHNFLKKIKSRYGYLSKESDDPQHSNRIVVLKSGRKGMQNSENVTCHCSSLQSHHNLRIKGQSAKSCTDVKSKDKLSKPRDSESSIGPQCATISESVHKKLNMSTVSYSKKREIDIYLEAKRHLSERLSKVDEGDTFSSKHAPRTLGWMLSLPEHEFWATLSPKRDMEHGSASAQMRFSSSSNFQMANESSWQLQKEKKMSYPSPLRQNVEVPPCTDTSKPDGQLQIFDSKPSSPENFIPDTKFHNNICSTRDDLTSKGCVKNGETNDILQAGDFYLLELPSESNRTLVASGKQSIDAMNTCEEIQHLKCLRSDSPLENELLNSSSDVSSSSPSSIQRAEVLDGNDREEHPSPLYILEPIVIKDVSSPTSTITQPALQPLHIDFEEHSYMVSPPHPKINLSNCSEDHECISKYVRAVLQASGLNWDELSMKLHSSYELLDPSLFDEVELFHFESCCDHKLLFDCINEVLSGIYQRYFRFFPWVSFLEPKMWPVTLGANVVDEVIKGVNWYLLPPMMPRTLEQTVAKDMVMSGKWIDIRLDAEDIVIEMVEAILEELTMETVLEIQI